TRTRSNLRGRKCRARPRWQFLPGRAAIKSLSFQKLRGARIPARKLRKGFGRQIWATGLRAAREDLGDVFGTRRERRQLCNPAVAVSAITRVDGLDEPAVDGKRSDRNRVRPVRGAW